MVNLYDIRYLRIGTPNLEHAIDECDDVANVLESIALKNS